MAKKSINVALNIENTILKEQMMTDEDTAQTFLSASFLMIYDIKSSDILFLG